MTPAVTCWSELKPTGGGGHFGLFIVIPNMTCVLLLLSCQIVRLQAAGTKPTTFAAVLTRTWGIHFDQILC